MAIAKNPKSNFSAVSNVVDDAEEEKAKEFLNKAADQSPATDENPKETTPTNKKPIMVRVDPELLKRFDKAAKRLGITRSAFLVSSAAEKLEKMEQVKM
jgi:predicted HicB family RNase H-like nuclease